MGEEERKPKTERLGFRADQELATRVNDLINAMERSSLIKGFDVNTTVALKMLVRRALPLAELEYEGSIPGMTPEEEGEYLLSELHDLIIQVGLHSVLGNDDELFLEIGSFRKRVEEAMKRLEARKSRS